MTRVAFVLMGSFLFSCHSPAKQPVTAIVSKPVLRSFENKEVPGGMLVLPDRPEAEAFNASLEGDLYGRFFYERAEFFVIDNPTNTLHRSKVKSITLYYLDGQLSQTKYILDDNIVDRLIHNYGNFKIAGRDAHSREIISSQPIVHRTGTGWRLNDQLTRYELIWSVGNKQIKYGVDITSSKEPFTYWEQLKDYPKKFKTIEHAGG